MKIGTFIFFALCVYVLLWLIKNRGLLIMFRAMKSYSKGETAKGLVLMDKALNYHLKPDNRLTCGYFLLKEGRLERAEEVIAPLREAKAKKFDPRQAVIYYSLVLWKRGELDTAVESLEELLSQSFENSILYNNLGFFLLEKGDYQRALEVNLLGLEFNNTSAVIRDNLVLNYIKLDQWEKAQEISDTLLTELPNFPDAYYNRAQIHIHKEEWDQARDLLLRAEGKIFSYLSTIGEEQIAAVREALPKS